MSDTVDRRPKAVTRLRVLSGPTAASPDGVGADPATASDAAAPNPAVVQTAWARVLMDSLRQVGVDRAVISPGSRSTPFALAAEHVGMITENIIDERSAGFFALGYARASQRPAVLICTSGSAGAHYFPAVIEAAEARLPLVILTADRPPELHGCGASQTIDQTRLFGHFARSFVNLGLPDASRTSLRALCRRAASAVHTAQYPLPGPVHINACARKPLEPAAPDSAADIAVVERADDVLRAFRPRASEPMAMAGDDILESLTRACAAASRGLIIAGPAAPGQPAGSDFTVQAAFALARATGYPLLCEAASQLRFAAELEPDEPEPDQPLALIDAFDLLCDDPAFASAARPEIIIQIGRPPISGAFARYLADNLDCVHCVISENSWPDPQGSVDLLVAAEPADTLRQLAVGVAEQVAEGRIDNQARRAWADLWTDANQLAWTVVEQALGGAGAGTADDQQAAMREGQAMAAAVAAVPERSSLLLGNSLPIRTVDTYIKRRPSAIRVLSQRGASGIDGWLSAAAGTAWLHGARYAATPSLPTVAIIGDVACTHDIGGLAVCARTRSPLCIVVIDNRGGRIFEHLPIATAEYGAGPEIFANHFLTQPACDLQAASAAFAIDYRRVDSPEALAAAVAEASVHARCTLVHAVVEPGSSRADRAYIRARLREHFGEFRALEAP